MSKITSLVLFFRKYVPKSFLIIILSIFIFIQEANSKVFFLEAEYYQDKAQGKIITLGKGEIISSDAEIVRVAVSDPNIADIQVLNEKQLLARGKKLGNSTFIIWEKSKNTPSRFDISVWPDINYLSKQLDDISEGISVEYIPPSQTSVSSGESQQSAFATAGDAVQPQSSQTSSATGSTQSQGSGGTANNGKIILKGQVKNAEVIARALQIAGVYVGDQGIKIISQPGGQVVDGLAGNYDIYSNSDSGDSSQASGSAPSFGARDQIKFTTNRYANLSRGVIVTTQNGSVISFLTVKDPPQISVAIRFYEISRNLARSLGLNATLSGNTIQSGSFIGGMGISQIFGGFGSISRLNGFMSSTGDQGAEFAFGPFKSPGGSILLQEIADGVTGAIFYPRNGLGLLIQALQERGEIKSLAEPTLVISNGEPASFLAGGEVPIVRSVFTAGGASQDVTYEPFGIRFSILPTITSEDKIHLQLVPEIRDIDTELSNFVAAPGSSSVRPPAFRTRRTQTQVELDAGQAFAISGLLRDDNTRNLRKVPGIGDIPILGTLFRSKSFKKGETELLIVVTPEIVKPTTPGNIAKAELSVPDVPYHDFDNIAPLRPFIKFEDEKGPEMKKPMDAIWYNQSSIFRINNELLKEKQEAKKQPLAERTSLANEVSGRIKENQSLSIDNKPTFLKQKLKDKLALLSNKNNNDLNREEKLIQEQEKLKEMWKVELARYTQAKEAMKIARENKY